ncbi:MAG: UDP-N-acetylmuramyl-tripeptide synthetase [Candidatus Pacebacteria bacterium]|nr:UDP-N-acetylmuramyl-tripeptide synthetase [Candidatus Paceibacterota bacterium]MBP9840076.1 UDP-N-acetylmuramyl-tripeptide synthetase [Candidatus Paceibacterota bacterium]
MNTLKRIIRSLLPRRLYRALLSPYHFLISLFAALRYGFPARRLTVILVTGTKGKSSVTEMLFTVLRHAGIPAAVAGTIRFAINDESRANLYKMTLPGHGFIQHFLADAVRAGAKVAVVEVTSEAVLQHRHRFLSPNALVFTNLQMEHIESHGSFEKYAAAKLRIGYELAKSGKRPRAIIANADDRASAPYLALPVENVLPYRFADVTNMTAAPGSVSFTHDGTNYQMSLPGSFSVMNALAVIRAARFAGVAPEKIADALRALERIPGRTERIEAGQDFHAIVDYAHTPDSLKALYSAYPCRKICVLGNTGGGRDTWKRPLMGAIADESCEEVILTNEDPYDEDPAKILEAMAGGMNREPRIILDRREAIKTALSLAKSGDAVLVTGKGTDPYIMGANGEKVSWSDADVMREELAKLVSTRAA